VTADELRAAARGGRVVSSEFLDPSEADRLLAAVQEPGVEATAGGGYPGARRRVVVVRPEVVPEATVQLVALYLEGVDDEGTLRAAFREAGVPSGRLGDVLLHGDGASVLCLAPPPPGALGPLRVGGASVHAQQVPLERVAKGRARTLEAVVPALRVDVLGARAFGVSRSYFAKGVAAGRVQVNGRAADKRSEAQEGDSVWAEGLGRFRVLAVRGETRKGNVKVSLEVERV
jgi:RNA-binding protein YlmH